jgi:Protein of unknown function (DUF4012)
VKRAAGSGIVALALLVAAFFAGSGYLAVRDLQLGVDRLEHASATIGGGPATWTPERIADARRAQQDAHALISEASSRLRANPLLRASSVVPGLRGQVQATLDLAAASDDASIAAGALIEVAERYQSARQGAGPTGPRLIDTLAGSAPLTADAQLHLERAIRILEGDLATSLLPPLASQVRSALGRLRTAHDAVVLLSGLASYLPAAAGKSGSRTYLLLFVNPSELRPAGGFVGVFGTMTVSDGTPNAFAVGSTTDLESLSKTRYPIPRALGTRLSFVNSSLDIGDAGWDPDYPSTARLSEQMYQSATGRTVDGTIAIDPYAIAALLKITGPVEVAPYGSFDDQNFFSKLDSVVNVRRDPASGKKALGPISQAILLRLVQAPADRWMAALSTGRDQAAARHIQLFMHDPALAAATHAAGYDGSIAATADGHDYLMVVDANVGGTKGDLYVQKHMEGKVEVSPQGFARHELILRYKYPAGVADSDVAKGQDLAYRDYVRFYLPETSTLLAYYQLDDGGHRGGAVEEVSVEHGKRVVGAFFRLPPGHSTELHVLFQDAVHADGKYQLYVQKQAGLPARPLDLLISSPGGLTRRQMTGDRDQQAVVRW